MANDIRIVSSGGRLTLDTYRHTVKTNGGVATIAQGWPVKAQAAYSAGTTPGVMPVQDDDITVGTDQPFIGVTNRASTDTASANGDVDVYKPYEGITYAALAKTASLANTAALILAMQGKYLSLDLTSSVYTFDTADTDVATNLFMVVGGDPNISEIWFMTRAAGTLLGSPAV